MAKRITYSSVSNPRWSDAANTAIELAVVFRHLGTAPVPFRAMADDIEPHGRELFARAVAGDFGAVSAYVEDPTVTMRRRRDAAIQSLTTAEEDVLLGRYKDDPAAPPPVKDYWDAQGR